MNIEQGTQVILNQRLLGRGERYLNNAGRPYCDKDIIAAFGDKRVTGYKVVTNPRGLTEIIPVLDEPKQSKKKTKKKSKKKTSKPVIDFVAQDVCELTTREDVTNSEEDKTEEPVAEG